MKSPLASSLLLSSLSLSLALALPQPNEPRATSSIDVADGMKQVISGKAKCARHAVLFARGTFDSGNIGVWVGPALARDADKFFVNDVAFQGVAEKDYPASLSDYVKTSGSPGCATSCAKTVADYVGKCPDAAVFLAGWSQGALCTHTCIDKLKSSPALKNIKAITTFGDEAALMDPKLVPPFPTTIPVQQHCVEDTAAPDILCSKTLTSGIKLPASLSDYKDVVLDAMAGLAKVAANEDQRKSVPGILYGMASGFLGVTDEFLRDVKAGKVRRWAVLPPHFEYARNGMTEKAVRFMVEQVKSKKAAA